MKIPFSHSPGQVFRRVLLPSLARSAGWQVGEGSTAATTRQMFSVKLSCLRPAKLGSARTRLHHARPYPLACRDALAIDTLLTYRCAVDGRCRMRKVPERATFFRPLSGAWRSEMSQDREGNSALSIVPPELVARFFTRVPRLTDTICLRSSAGSRWILPFLVFWSSGSATGPLDRSAPYQAAREYSNPSLNLAPQIRDPVSLSGDLWYLATHIPRAARLIAALENATCRGETLRAANLTLRALPAEDDRTEAGLHLASAGLPSGSFAVTASLVVTSSRAARVRQR